MREQAGFSVIEVILAAALFMIIATGSITVILQGLDSNRLGEEQTVANQYAAEGMEAVRSIKNQAYTNLTNTTLGKGVTQAGGVWTFKADGTNDLFTPYPNKTYTRVLKVESVSRNGIPPVGDIVTSGTNDPDTKKITSTVSWNFTPSRANSVQLISYLSDWKKTITSADSAILAYTDTVNTGTTPKYRTYTNSSNSFGAETGTIVGAVGRNYIVRTSPTKKEAIVGYVDNAASGVLRIMCYNGTTSTWTNDWTVTVGGTGTTRRFDIAYETSSGDVLVLYSTNAGTNELAYRTKAGTAECGSWSAATTFDSPITAGVVYWVKMGWDRFSTSNLISAIWADANLDLQGAMWNGTAWVQRTTAAMETSLEVVGTSTTPNVDDFDVEFESTSGDVLAVWANSVGANGTNGVRYMTCPGRIATCTWSAVLTPPTLADDAQNLDISANPNDNQIIFASIGAAGADLQVGRWDGAAWVNVANKDITARVPIAGSQNVATGWTISGTTVRGIVVYHDAVTTGIISYLTMTPGATPTWSATLTASPVPTMGTLQNWYNIEMDPKVDSSSKDTLMLTASNSVLDLFAKRLVMNATPIFTWTDANTGVALETNLGQATVGPFGFAYWRNP